MNECIADKPRWITHAVSLRSTSKGQATVEFTVVFVSLLIIAWIPADFGLPFYTGQQPQSAPREGKRIAAAGPTLSAQHEVPRL